MTRILKVSIILFFSVVVAFNFTLKGEYFTRLAESFWSGKTYFLTQPDGSWLDTTPDRGNYYSPHGPFPAVFLLPFVLVSHLLGVRIYHGYIQPLLVILVFYLCYKVARKVKYEHEDSLFLAFAFCFSTVFLGSALWPGFIAHTLVTLLIFLLIYNGIQENPTLQGGDELNADMSSSLGIPRLSRWGGRHNSLNKVPEVLLGLFVGLLLLTRASSVGILVFPLMSILTNKGEGWIEKTKKVFLLCTPVILAFILFFAYNWIRFQNVFEFGYTNAINLAGSTKARDYGVLSLYHIPGNLYYFLLATPLPVFKDEISHVLTFPFVKADPWGMSIFVTSPIFGYLFLLSYKDKLSKILMLTISVIAFSIFLYYAIGSRQFGYRYALDFLPLLFFLLIKNYKNTFGKLSDGFKLLIFVSSLTNLYFFITAYFMN